MSGSTANDFTDDDDDGPDNDPGIDAAINAPWSAVKSALKGGSASFSQYGTSKTVVTTAMTVGSIGLTGAQLGTQTSSLAVAGAIAAGAAVSATGLGLVIAGGVLTVSGMALSTVSMAKSAAHVTGLKKIQNNTRRFSACACAGQIASLEMTNDHGWIATKVLPYIISQKTEKAVKKGAGILPGVSLLTNVYRLGRYAFKKDRGKKRNFYAHVLTRHLITHDCALAGAIVAELYSSNEMLVLRQFDSDQSGPLIAKKMKSV